MAEIAKTLQVVEAQAVAVAVHPLFRNV